MSGSISDLIVLTADPTMKIVLETVLNRNQALDIRTITANVVAHPERDPGCRVRGLEFINPFANQFKYGLVIYDLEGSGSHNNDPRDEEAVFEAQLPSSLWANRCKAIVINPELDNWIWVDSQHFLNAVKWPGSLDELRNKVMDAEFYFDQFGKPHRPKEAFQMLLEANRIPRSSSLYKKIASRASVRRCKDGSFKRLITILQEWFGAETTP